jgi:hypothetical protein
VSKEAYTVSKETYTVSKEAYTVSKETSLLSSARITPARALAIDKHSNNTIATH